MGMVRAGVRFRLPAKAQKTMDARWISARLCGAGARVLAYTKVSRFMMHIYFWGMVCVSPKIPIEAAPQTLKLLL